MSYTKQTGFFLLIFILITGLWSCEVIDPDDPVPSYIYIEDISLNTLAGQGTSAQSFSDAWVYLDDELIGAFELPAMVPLIAEGKHEVSIKPGVILNGISSTRAAYPFTGFFRKEVDLIKEEIDTLNVNTSYYDNVTFPWTAKGQEDFEQGGIAMDSTADSDAMIIRQSNEVFEGSYSGLIQLDSVGSVFEIQSTENFNYPGATAPVFLEMHYKNNNRFVVGVKLYYYTGKIKTNPIVVLNPSDNWNKLYLNLTPTLTRENPALQHYKIYFSGNINEDDVSSASIYLDNLKLLTSSNS